MTNNTTELSKIVNDIKDITDKITLLINKTEDKSMINNLDKIKEIIKNKEWNELLNYNEYDLELYNDLFNLFNKNNNIDNKILIYVIDNIKNLNAINESDDEYKKPLIHYVLMNKIDLELIKYLIDIKNIDLEVTNSKDTKPIHYIIRFYGIELIKYLLGKNIKLDVKNINGWGISHYIYYYQNYDTIKWFINNYKYLVKLNEPINMFDGKESNYTIIELLLLNNRLTDNNKVELLKLIHNIN